MTSRPPTESGPKDGESESDDKAPMDRFNDLAKGVFGVSRESYEKEEKRYRERPSGGKGRPPKPA